MTMGVWRRAPAECVFAPEIIIGLTVYFFLKNCWEKYKVKVVHLTFAADGVLCVLSGSNHKCLIVPGSAQTGCDPKMGATSVWKEFNSKRLDPRQTAGIRRTEAAERGKREKPSSLVRGNLRAQPDGMCRDGE